MTIFFDNTGPLVVYNGEFIQIEDLNPQIETRWRMSRWEMARFAMKALFAAILRSRLNRNWSGASPAEGETDDVQASEELCDDGAPRADNGEARPDA